MDTIQKSCQDMQKKQVVMQDTILDKLSSFKELLEQKRQSLTGKFNSISKLTDMLKKLANRWQQSRAKHYRNKGRCKKITIPKTTKRI